MCLCSRYYCMCKQHVAPVQRNEPTNGRSQDMFISLLGDAMHDCLYSVQKASVSCRLDCTSADSTQQLRSTAAQGEERVAKVCLPNANAVIPKTNPKMTAAQQTSRAKLPHFFTHVAVGPYAPPQMLRSCTQVMCSMRLQGRFWQQHRV